MLINWYWQEIPDIYQLPRKIITKMQHIGANNFVWQRAYKVCFLTINFLHAISLLFYYGFITLSLFMGNRTFWCHHFSRRRSLSTLATWRNIWNWNKKYIIFF